MSTNSAGAAGAVSSANELFIETIKQGDLGKIQGLFGASTIDVNYQRAKDGKTALHMAYGFRHYNLIPFLIENGADITIKDNDDDNPIDYLIVMIHHSPIDDNVKKILEYSLTIPNITEKNRKDIARIIKKYKVIGKGTYGLVISPEFKTMNESKVTKFMFQKKNYNLALNATNSIRMRVPLLSNGLPSKYNKEYKFKNVAANNEYVAEELKALRPNIQNENMVYPLKMENLGVSFNNLNNTHIRTIAAIPIKTILEQYLKLAYTIKQIGQQGYIHGDIRETNIVINLSTGKITIIDFDWFLPYYEFMEDYGTQFYSHPPELIFAKDKFNKIITSFSKPITVGEFNKIVNEQLEIIDEKYHFDKIHTIDGIKEGVIETMNALHAESIPLGIPSKNNNTDDELSPISKENLKAEMLFNKPTSALMKNTFNKNNFLPAQKSKLYKIYENNSERPVKDLLGKYKRQILISYRQIDSYGLGYSLSIFHNFLEKTIPLRPAEDKEILDKLKVLVNALCNPAFHERMTIGNFEKNITELLDSLPTENASVLASGSDSGAVASAASHGGKRKQTRRRRMYRKKTYRKCRN